ncbi:hypothetical protein AB733_11935 [Photobacterium swingsii]|uniref:Class I SAM-dependent methyltransferase n=1 Tax=Photobacterium swingsii TaxID=680026 RepID=A0A0J8VBA6_9GAMM|nr:class I SAM-dependent methyltransferase [Photobacterium swingsii]KMV30377.1 hypothetical protein AB733_11935 [Photobacterium swingsii]PSW24452.1 class I SAM-dependent methyltransferase [Photobacterium swingsii]
MTNYYIENAKSFIDDTLFVDMSEIYTPFLDRLEVGAKILDIGCGSGRDLLFFKNAGFVPTGLEPSMPLAEHARNYAKVEVWGNTIQGLKTDKKFNGVWACASLLHIPSNELKACFQKIANLVIGDGVIYASFKHGTFEGIRNGRFFNFQTLETLQYHLPEALKVDEFWISSDKRKERSDEWLNIVLSCKRTN